MTIRTKIWDPTADLKTSEAIAAYLTAAFEDGDPMVIAAALGDVTKARGLSREALYQALREYAERTQPN